MAFTFDPRKYGEPYFSTTYSLFLHLAALTIFMQMQLKKALYELVFHSLLMFLLLPIQHILSTSILKQQLDMQFRKADFSLINFQKEKKTTKIVLPVLVSALVSKHFPSVG